MFLHGYAGTGKSFISLYLLMSQMMNDSSFKKLKIVRSTVPSRDQGFLPGSAAEKAKIYEAPYQAIFTELFGRSDAYDYFKRRGLVEFESTSYLRGTTWNDTLVLFDEFQNTSYNEAMTVLTRIGDNCRIIVSGDFHQTDLKRDDEKRGILDIIKILKKVNLVDFFEFKKEDIVRSGFVRELILAEAKYKFEKS
jgi:phosphate starvation-inducible protein PhoH